MVSITNGACRQKNQGDKKPVTHFEQAKINCLHSITEHHQLKRITTQAQALKLSCQRYQSSFGDGFA